MPEVLVNGKPDNRVAIDDRGLLYGDGLFETIALVNGKVRLAELHLERLADGCKRLGIEYPDQQALLTEIALVGADKNNAVIKVIVTRGRGPRGYSVSGCGKPTRIVSIHAWPQHATGLAEQGVHVRVCETRLANNPRLAGIKHLNRLEQILARMEWENSGEVQEGLMLDGAGYVVCGTMSNVFAVTDGVLLTPALDECGVAGVMRRHILNLAQNLNIETRIERLPIDQLDRCDELLLSNAIIGIWPVIRIGQRVLDPGPVTKKLLFKLNTMGG